MRNLSCGHQGPQPPRPFGSAELPQRLGLDLPDPLARDSELLIDLFKRVLALTADAKSGDLRGTTGSWWFPRLPVWFRPVGGIAPRRGRIPVQRCD